MRLVPGLTGATAEDDVFADTKVRDRARLRVGSIPEFEGLRDAARLRLQIVFEHVTNFIERFSQIMFRRSEPLAGPVVGGARQVRKPFFDGRENTSMNQHAARADPLSRTNLVARPVAPEVSISRLAFSENRETLNPATEVGDADESLSVRHKPVDGVHPGKLVRELFEARVSAKPVGVAELQNHVVVRREHPFERRVHELRSELVSRVRDERISEPQRHPHRAPVGQSNHAEGRQRRCRFIPRHRQQQFLTLAQDRCRNIDSRCGLRNIDVKFHYSWASRFASTSLRRRSSAVSLDSLTSTSFDAGFGLPPDGADEPPASRPVDDFWMLAMNCSFSAIVFLSASTSALRDAFSSAKSDSLFIMRA